MGLIGECLDRHIKSKARIGNFLNECYSEQTSNHADMVSINEVNARSLIDRHSKDGYVIVSPCRGGDDFKLDANDPAQKERLNQINRGRIKYLINQIKASGYAYTPVYGGFIENKGTDHEENVYERSFVIYNHYRDGSVGDFDDLRKFAIQIANDYNQDSVLVKAPDGKPEYIKKDGSLDFGFSDDVAFNDLTQEYFTDLHNNTDKKMKDGSKPTRFSFLECYINPAPQCYGERVKRSYLGEVFISR